VRAPERVGELVATDPHHQPVAAQCDRHVAPQQERQPAEHRLLRHRVPARELLADAVREVFVVCHVP
jgi:hypothetical protein